MAPLAAAAGDAEGVASPDASPPWLDLGYRRGSAGENAPGGGRLPLATVSYGRAPLMAPAAGMAISIPLAQLGDGCMEEVWSTPERPVVERSGPVTLAVAGPVLFGAVEAAGSAPGELEAATGWAYRSLLRAAVETGHPHPLRFWNVVPEINGLEEGLERYRRFCRARAEALEELLGPRFPAELCASSAVGSREGQLTVCLLSAREPGAHRENPRQVSAYEYPPEYGPRSPSFARATRCPDALGGALLLSGTASIVGHRTVHPECKDDQLQETLSNLRVLAGLPDPGRPAFRSLKVYLRHPSHLAPVSRRLEEVLGSEVPVLYLQADICRRELLLEIEGVA